MQAASGKDAACRGLRFGSFLVDFVDGDLRYLRCGDRELVRRVYVAVRDVNWGTTPGVLRDVVVDRREDGFRVTFAARHEDAEIDFEWMGTIEGRPDGTLSYTMDGVMHGDARYCRIGLCVLHPIDGHRDARWTARTQRGPAAGTLPRITAPQPFEGGVWHALTPPFDALTLRLEDGTEVRASFEGDLFELEDQRNWTDNSFKTYCTPIGLGYPHAASAGQAFRQAVTFSVAERAPDRGAAECPPALRLGEVLGPVPRLGLGMDDGRGMLTEREAKLLRALRLDHLRVDVLLGERDWPAALERAAETALTLGCGLEVAVFIADDTGAGLDLLAAAAAGLPVHRWLVFHVNEAVERGTSPEWVRLARAVLGPVVPSAVIAGGTNGEFASINRERPHVESFDALCYPVNPQVHLADDDTLIEAVEGQAETVVAAKLFAPGLPIVVSRVTLKQPFNPWETEVVGPADIGTLPPTVDVRQSTPFGAAWTIASLVSLSEAGVASVTYYETVGPRGVIERDDPPPLAGLPRLPGATYPVYGAFAALADRAGGRVVRCSSSRPLEFRGLAFEVDGRRHVLVANLGTATQHVPVGPLRGCVAVVSTVVTGDPDDREPGPSRAELVPIVGGTVQVVLGPHGIVRIDEQPRQ
jgi:D-apionolactonase